MLCMHAIMYLLYFYVMCACYYISFILLCYVYMLLCIFLYFYVMYACYYVSFILLCYVCMLLCIFLYFYVMYACYYVSLYTSMLCMHAIMYLFLLLCYVCMLLCIFFEDFEEHQIQYCLIVKHLNSYSGLIY